jgi:hypothetical protein
MKSKRSVRKPITRRMFREAQLRKVYMMAVVVRLIVRNIVENPTSQSLQGQLSCNTEGEAMFVSVITISQETLDCHSSITVRFTRTVLIDLLVMNFGVKMPAARIPPVTFFE